jgi:hypothetical protein
LAAADVAQRGDAVSVRCEARAEVGALVACLTARQVSIIRYRPSDSSEGVEKDSVGL